MWNWGLKICFSYGCVFVITGLLHSALTVRFVLRELSIFLLCFECAIKWLGNSSVLALLWLGAARSSSIRRSIFPAMETDDLSIQTFDSSSTASTFRDPRKDFLTAEHHGLPWESAIFGERNLTIVNSRNLKCIWQNFFYLLDVILMQFSYENRKKQMPYHFYFLVFETYKSVKFHFRLGAKPRKTEDWR